MKQPEYLIQQFECQIFHRRTVQSRGKGKGQARQRTRVRRQPVGVCRWSCFGAGNQTAPSLFIVSRLDRRPFLSLVHHRRPLAKMIAQVASDACPVYAPFFGAMVSASCVPRWRRRRRALTWTLS
jgi:hypothetical protein